MRGTLLAAALACVGCQGCQGLASFTPAPRRTHAVEPERAVRPAARVAFASERDGDHEIYSVAADGSDLRRETSSASEDYPAPAGPGGQLLVVSREGDEQSGVEWLSYQGKASPRARMLRNPSWLPDASGAVVESSLESFRDLYLYRFASGELQRLTTSDNGCFEPAVSPDGHGVAFVSTAAGDPEIHVLDLATGRQTRLTWSPGSDSEPAWAPGGRELAFMSTRTGTRRVFTMHADGSSPRALRAQVEPELLAERDVAWSPDGAHVAMVAQLPGRAGLRIVRVADGAVVASRDGDADHQLPTWSPDGRFVAFTSTTAGNTDVYAMRSDGGLVARLTDAPGADWLPRWIAP